MFYYYRQNNKELQKRIVELVEKFPKLSGLSELVAKNLSLKTEKGLIPISDKNLDSFIKSRDVIFFDLEFNEIWLEIEMTLISEDNNFKMSFEIKVKVDSYISELRHVLIKMGIKSWAKYILDDDDCDYYIFSKFSIIYTDNEENRENSEHQVELENFHGKFRIKILNPLFRTGSRQIKLQKQNQMQTRIYEFQ